MHNFEPAINVRNLMFSYKPGVEVLNIKDLTINSGETVFLFGPSGSGKTTLLGLLSGILAPTQGDLIVLGENLSTLSGSLRDALRASKMGYIFQMFNLIPYLTVHDNIILPCRMNAARRARVQDSSLDEGAARLANLLGISQLLYKKVTELSVGQQQRVAAARALLGAPKLIIADEPTSALDMDHREQFLQLLFKECQIQNSTLVFVSHDRQLMPLFQRNLSLAEINSAAGIK